MSTRPPSLRHWRTLHLGNRTYISPASLTRTHGFRPRQWVTKGRLVAHKGLTIVRGGSTGEHYVASRLFDASAVGSWRSLRPSGPPLEPEDGLVYLRHSQQHSHRRSRPDRADAASGPAGGE